MSEPIATLVLQHLQAACDPLPVADGLQADTPLATLGIHSLRLIELVYELEVSLEVQVDEEHLARLQTVGDVQHMFAAAVRASGRDPDRWSPQAQGAAP
jgi:acyl carrier protein